MKVFWTDEELNRHWLLAPGEIVLVKGKANTGRIVFCFLLKHYQHYACFPIDLKFIPDDIHEFLAAQLGCIDTELSHLTSDSSERMMRRYCKEIRSFLNIRRFDSVGRSAFHAWSIKFLFPVAPDAQQKDADIRRWFTENSFELPSAKVLSRLLGTAEQEFERGLFLHVSNGLSSLHRAGLNRLLETSEGASRFSQLRLDTGNASLENVMKTIARLALLREIGLPKDTLCTLKPSLIERYRLRAGSEDVWEMRRHSETTRLALLCFYCVPRESEIIDGLVDLLISITHKISVQAERKVISELVGDITKVHGKTNLLFRIAEAANDHPGEIIRDVIFPVAGEQTIADLVKEYRSDGPAYVKRIYRKIRTSYARHYRRMLPKILNILEFKSNNSSWCPLLDAIELLKLNTANTRYLSIDEAPVKEVVPAKWQDNVFEEDAQGHKRVNRISYEICMLQSLREKLRSKEIWIVGARRFCNPENDLPQDFDENRKQYYATLGQPLGALNFVNDIKDKMRTALDNLGSGLIKANI